MKRILVFAYGLVSYLVFFVVFLYLLGFLGNFLVPKSIDSGADGAFWPALLINTGLVLLFGLQHSVMARPTFKKWWTKLVPKPVERSTYVMATNVVLVLMFWLWRPMGGVVWSFNSPVGQAVMYSLFALGWILVFITTWLINHFDLFGLKQVWLYLRGKEYTGSAFVTPGPYKFVRHPLYVGWLTAFWATPTMTVSHLIFAAGMSVYILIAIYFEERNLVEHHGSDYAKYRQRVGMLIPKAFNRRTELPTTRAAETRSAT